MKNDKASYIGTDALKFAALASISMSLLSLLSRIPILVIVNTLSLGAATHMSSLSFKKKTPWPEFYFAASSLRALAVALPMIGSPLSVSFFAGVNWAAFWFLLGSGLLVFALGILLVWLKWQKIQQSWEKAGKINMENGCLKVLKSAPWGETKKGQMPTAVLLVPFVVAILGVFSRHLGSDTDFILVWIGAWLLGVFASAMAGVSLGLYWELRSLRKKGLELHGPQKAE